MAKGMRQAAIPAVTEAANDTAAVTYTPGTIEAVRFNILEERRINTAASDNAKEKSVAYRNVVLAMLDYAKADEKFTGADWSREYWNGTNKMPENNALVQRNSQHQRMIDAARSDLALTKAIWPTPAEAKELKVKVTTKDKFLKGVTVINDAAKRGEKATREQCFAAMHPAVVEVWEAPTDDDYALANAGDLLALIVEAGNQLYGKGAAAFAPYQTELLAILAKYDASRAAGELRTSAEAREAATGKVV